LRELLLPSFLLYIYTKKERGEELNPVYSLAPPFGNKAFPGGGEDSFSMPMKE
jgi:hypothetical protein